MNSGTVAAVVARRRVEAKARADQRGDGGLAPEDEDFIGEMFAKYDKNDDGGLQETEIAALMADLNDGQQVPASIVKDYVKRYDTNRNGEIDKKEVRKLVAAWYISVEETRVSESGCSSLSLNLEVTTAAAACLPRLSNMLDFSFVIAKLALPSFDIMDYLSIILRNTKS
eukprot:scaffold556068_cov38-Prasinocladus_malaysianus.AAC.2